jgi:hypothetical protein
LKYEGERVEAKPLTLPPLDSDRKADDDFMRDLVVAANELRQATCTAAHIVPEIDLEPVHFAVLMGLMVRLHKLYDSFVSLICDHRLEIALIVGRSACDTAVDIRYLCRTMDPVEFGKFIKSSLGTSKKLYDAVDEDRSQRRGNPAIQDRIQDSIREDYSLSGYSMDEVKYADTWGFGKTESRAKACGMTREYLFVYKNLSRVTHGSWSELLSYHLLRSKGLWYPNMKYAVPKASALDGTSLLITDATAVYVGAIAPKCEAVDRLDRIREWFLAMAYKHETFLSRSG